MPKKSPRNLAGAKTQEEEHDGRAPMVPEDYDKEEEMRFGCNCEWGGPAVHHPPHLQTDLLNTVYWSGKCWKDYLFFLCNWHPIISMLFSHPGHPYSKFERLFAFMVGCALTLLPTALVVMACARGVEIADEKTEIAKHHASAALGLTTTMPPLGALGWNATVTTPQPEYVEGAVGAGVVLVFITIPVMIVEIMLYQVAVLDAYCQDSKNPICGCLKCVVKGIRECCFCISCCWASFIFGISMLVLWAKDLALSDIIKPWFESRLQSWVLWLPLHLLLPLSGFLWRWCHEKWEHEAAHSDSESEEA